MSSGNYFDAENDLIAWGISVIFIKNEYTTREEKQPLWNDDFYKLNFGFRFISCYKENLFYNIAIFIAKREIAHATSH